MSEKFAPSDSSEVTQPSGPPLRTSDLDELAELMPVQDLRKQLMLEVGDPQADAVARLRSLVRRVRRNGDDELMHTIAEYVVAQLDHGTLEGSDHELFIIATEGLQFEGREKRETLGSSPL